MKTTETIINEKIIYDANWELHKTNSQIDKIESYLKARPWETTGDMGIVSDTVVSQIKAAKQKAIELREYVTLLEKYLNERNNKGDHHGNK